MNRFFTDTIDTLTNTAYLEGDDFRHAIKVLRMKEGDRLLLCNGHGTDYEAEVSRIEKDRLVLDILSGFPSLGESDIKVTLFQGLPKSGKMELIIQKCVELGIYEIVPVKASRSVVKVSGKDESGKLTRYNRIAYEAAKQSQRGIIPNVLGFTTFQDADFSGFDAIIIAYEEETERSLKQALAQFSSAKRIALIIGPEGGLERSEVEHISNLGGTCVSLGKRILRTETAGMATLAMIMYDLNG